MIMGGAGLCGQQIHGQYPLPEDYALGQGLDVGKNGRMLPTTSVDQYVTEMALWLGVPYNDLAMVLPNVGNFYTPGNTTLPIGYLKPEALPTTAFQSTVPTAVSLSEAEAIAQSAEFELTKSGLIAGSGLAATAALVALRNRQTDE